MPGLDAFHRLLLRMEPEQAHERAIGAMRLAQAAGIPLRWLGRRCRLEDSRLEQLIWGKRFGNPVGLAAGYDKDGRVIRGMSALGFGFLEVGTVTPKPQPGNPRPRVFRHTEERSLQNALGFNNSGGVAMARSLQRQRPYPVPLGVNLGKNKDTPPEKAIRDYEALVDQLGELADYIVVNVSSPNTPGLRDMQRQETTVGLVTQCRSRTTKPVLVKLAPDLADSEALDVSLACVEAGAAGIVVTNTTIDYSLLPGVEKRGGLSGRVLKKRSYEVLRLLANGLRGRSTLISVGGIESAADVYARLRAGATLVQLYTALIYEGPLLVNRILRGLLRMMDEDGIDNIEALIGIDIAH